MFTMPSLNRSLLGSLFLLSAIAAASGQTGPEPPSAYSIATPRPISPAEGTTTAEAQLASARELDQQTADQVKAEISPEIDSLRAQVQRQAAEQQFINAGNQQEKDKLALARIIGLSVEQDFVTTDVFAHDPLPALSYESVKAEALQLRADLASVVAGVRAAEYVLSAKRSQRLPVVTVNANYGGAGANVGNSTRSTRFTATFLCPSLPEAASVRISSRRRLTWLGDRRSTKT